MTIRQAVSQDAARILAIWNAEINAGISTFNSEPLRIETIAAMLEERPKRFFVFESSAGVLGFASFGQFREGIGYRHTAEHTVYLSADARGQGIGRALAEAVARQAKREGIHALIAAIGGENKGAVAFHEALGFQNVGHLPEAGHKFGRWMDLILMQKIL